MKVLNPQPLTHNPNFMGVKAPFWPQLSAGYIYKIRENDKQTIPMITNITASKVHLEKFLGINHHI